MRPAYLIFIEPAHLIAASNLAVFETPFDVVSVICTLTVLGVPSCFPYCPLSLRTHAHDRIPTAVVSDHCYQLLSLEDLAFFFCFFGSFGIYSAMYVTYATPTMKSP